MNAQAWKTPKRWYALEIVPSKLEAAMMFACRKPGFETMAPVEPRLKLVEAVIIGRPKLRWSPWIFITWPDRASFGWLFEGEGERAGIVRVMADDSGTPRPVPDAVIQNLRLWRPSKPVIEQPKLPSFKAGEIVHAYLVPGHAQAGVFMGYETGNDARSGMKATVRLWMMGGEREIPVPVSALLPAVDSDSQIRRKVASRTGC